MTNIEITDKHNELLTDFKWEFENYHCFKVSLVTDDTIQDCHGEEFENVIIRITDNENDLDWDVLINKNGTTHYNVYEDSIDEISWPSDLWKHMYFKVHRVGI